MNNSRTAGKPLKEVAIYGGTFDPIHTGHILVGKTTLDSGLVDEVWYLPAARNPLKPLAASVSEQQRLRMVEIALSPFPKLIPSGFEFHLPQPSYTYDTLLALSGEFPDTHFRILIGADNWLLFDKWRNADKIISGFGAIIYPRPGFTVDKSSLPPSVSILEDVSLADVSATEIRHRIAQGESTDGLLPPEVKEYILKNNLYPQL